MKNEKYLDDQKKRFNKILYPFIGVLGAAAFINFVLLENAYMGLFVGLFCFSCVSMIFFVSHFFKKVECPDCSKKLRLHRKSNNKNMFYDCQSCDTRWLSHIKIGDHRHH